MRSDRHTLAWRIAAVILLFASGSTLADGYDFETVYTGEFWRNTSGGLSTGTRYLDNLDVTLGIDIDEAWSFGSGTLFAYALYNNGSTLSDELVGDLQVVSNIDAPEAVHLFELWYEYREGPWSVRTGLYDLNSEFDAHDTGGLFINSSHGIGADFSQTGQNGPSIFPIASLALRWDYQWDDVIVRAAVLDGVPGNPDDAGSNRIDLGGEDGVLAVAEVDWSVNDQWRIWSGVWGYSADFDRLVGPGRNDDNRGAYIGAEYHGTLAGRPLAAFVRYGVANDDINPLSAYLGTGVVLTGPFVQRPDDQLGFAVATAITGDPYRANLENDGLGSQPWERNWQLSYRAPVNDWLVLEANTQFVQNPSATRSIDDALVLGVRFELGWGTSW